MQIQFPKDSKKEMFCYFFVTISIKIHKLELKR